MLKSLSRWFVDADVAYGHNGAIENWFWLYLTVNQVNRPLMQYKGCGKHRCISWHLLLALPCPQTDNYLNELHLCYPYCNTSVVKAYSLAWIIQKDQDLGPDDLLYSLCCVDWLFALVWLYYAIEASREGFYKVITWGCALCRVLSLFFVHTWCINTFRQSGDTFDWKESSLLVFQ